MTITPGAVDILSVGEGHIKLSFNSEDPIEVVRAARIVKDMLRRGYALLVATPGQDGKTVWTRARGFDEATHEYIVADFDPVAAAEVDANEPHAQPPTESEAGDPPPMRTDAAFPKRRQSKTKRIAAAGAEMVAVGRTAGG